MAATRDHSSHVAARMRHSAILQVLTMVARRGVDTCADYWLNYRNNLRYDENLRPMFLAITVVCFVFTVALIGFYPPTRVNMVFIGVYCAFFGVLVHVILSLEPHLSGIGAITPEALEAISRQVRQMQ